MTNQENSSIALPKNIRQIGTFGDKYRIYIEDFVYTYVHRFLHQRKRGDAVLAAVLLGKINVCGEQEYVFISGAQKVDFEIAQESRTDGPGKHEQEMYTADRHGQQDNEQEPCVSELPGRKENGSDAWEQDGSLRRMQKSGTGDDSAARQEEFWDRVYQRIKNSFDDLDILGWYFNLDGSSLEIHAQLQQFFESTYKKGSRFLYYEDSLEQTDAFFVQEQHRLQRLTGYAVYYEKNPQMQQFMMEEKERLTPRPLRESYLAEQHGDEAVQNYRAIMNKLNEKPKKNRMQPIVCAAGAAVLVIVAATAVTQIGNYQNLKVLQQTMEALSGSVNDDDGLSAEEDMGTEEYGAEPAASNDAAETEAADQNAADDSNDDISNDGGTAASADGSAGVSDDDFAAVSNEENTDASDAGITASADEGSVSDNAGGSADADAGVTETSAQTASGGGSTSAQSSNSGYYTVQSGDNLLSISQSVYNTTEKVEEICELNGIEDMDMIYVGQELLLP
ncbi:MAG: LysM peptidoglycan-binding domain-containing protein [Clostridiales bacterium]|nr:LysM peptidoglycan-binding domain-containing protein [Clostridiales bacterium]